MSFTLGDLENRTSAIAQQQQPQQDVPVERTQPTTTVAPVDENRIKEIANAASYYALDNKQEMYDLIAPMVRDDMKSNMVNPDPTFYFEKAREIDRGLKTAPGVFEAGLEKGIAPTAYRLAGPAGLGTLRTVGTASNFIFDTLTAVTNTIAGTASTIAKSPYEQVGLPSGAYSEKEMKRIKAIPKTKYIRNWQSGRRGLFGTIADIYKDSPEFVGPTQAIADSMRAAVKNPALIETREVDEGTKFWRPEATYLEQIVRTIPEFVGGVKLGGIILKRGHDNIIGDLAQAHNKLVDEGEIISKKIDLPDFTNKSAKKKFAKSNPFGEVNDADLLKSISKLKEDKILKFGNSITNQKYHGFMRNAYANRVASNVEITRMRDTIRQANRKIRDEKNVIAANAKERMEQAERLHHLRRGRWGAIPNAIKSNYITEAGATLGAIALGNIDEDYAWIGALGGGLTSGLGHKAVMTVYQGTKRYGRAIIGDSLRAAGLIDELSEAERMSLIRTGKLPVAAADRISKEEVNLLNNMGTLFTSLPEKIRARAINSMIKFQKDMESLKEQGIDTDALETTFDKITQLQPLMILRDSLGQASINASKKLTKEFDEDVLSVIDVDLQLEQQALVFRELMDKLKTQKGPDGQVLTGTQEVFTKNVRYLEDLYTQMTTDIKDSHKLIYNDIESIFDILSDPTLRTTADNVSELRRLREGIMEQLNRVNLEDVEGGLLTEKTAQIKAAVQRLTSTSSAENTQLILNTFDSLKKDVDAMDSLIKNPMFRGGSETLGSEGVGERLAGFLEMKASASKALANDKYDIIKEYKDYNRLDENGSAKPLAFNMTQWFRDLPEDGRLREDSSIIPKSPIDRTEQKLSGKFIREEKDLQVLLDSTSLEGVRDYFNRLSSRDARRFVNYVLDQTDDKVKEILESKISKLGQGEASHKEFLLDLEDKQLKALFGIDGKSLPDNLSLFDEVDVIHRELKREIDPLTLPPEMRMDATNVKEFSSTFNAMSRDLYNAGKRKKGRDYGFFGRSLLSHAADRGAQSGIDARNARGQEVDFVRDLAEANSHWLYNVFYVNQSKIGSKIFQFGDNLTAKTNINGERPFGSGYYKELPETWLDDDIGKRIAYGDASDARQVIQDLKVAFGTFNPKLMADTGFGYELDSEVTKRFVGDLLNDYVERFYRKQISLPLEQAKPVRPLQTVDRSIEGMQEALSARARRPTQDLPSPSRVQREYSAQNISGELGEDIMSAKQARDTLHKLVLGESDFLKTLNNEGYLDLEGFRSRVTEIKQLSVSKQKFERAEELLLKQLTTGRKGIQTEVNSRESVANNIFDFLELKKITGMQKHDQVLATFVEHPSSIDNVRRITDVMRKKSPKEAEKFKDVLSDLVMDAIMFRAGNLSKDATELTTAQLRNFDYKAVNEIVTNQAEPLKAIMGDEKFDMLEKFSNLIGMKNVSASDMASNGGVAIKVPGGLSLESMISRLYSISRGVISPKYVLTEAALLQIRKTNASILKKVINDPKTANRLLTILGNADTPSTEVMQFIQQYDKKIFQFLRSSLIEYQIEDEREKKDIKKEKENPRFTFR